MPLGLRLPAGRPRHARRATRRVGALGDIVVYGPAGHRVSMKLFDWARQNGITYKTAWKWWKAGKLPVPGRQMPTGTILVEAAERREAGAASVRAGVLR